MTVALIHPTGNANVRAAAAALHQAGWLQAFHTGVGWASSPWLPQALERRSYQLPARLVRAHPARELGRLLATRLGAVALTSHETGPFCVDRVYHHVDRASARAINRDLRRRLPPSVVYGYEDGALASFTLARARGLRTIYELPIGYHHAAQALFAEEAQRRPDWAHTLDGLRDSPAKLARKREELALADQIVVPSGFVRDTLSPSLSGLAPALQGRVAVIPYGCPPPLATPPEPRAAGPLRVLFVGGLSQRKGLADLLEAVALLPGRVELTLIGRIVGEACAPLQQALHTCRWDPSLPRSGVLEAMRCHDVLVLPSLWEGLPLVIGEALAQGLPVIATPNAAATELIEHGQQGFVVPIRDPAAIAAHLHQLATDSSLLQAMRAAALQRASQWSWQHYQAKLCTTVERVLNNQP